MLGYILFHQNLSFGKTENAYFWSFQNIDNQYQCNYKNISAFTGKERDRETGFGYCGARYYDSDLSGLFLSVDPMSDKYPSLSPYAYCAWSPVKLIDPNGMDTVVSINLNEGKTSYWCDNMSFNGTSIEIISNDNIIEKYICSGTVSIQSETSKRRTTLSFSDDKDAGTVFDFLNGTKCSNYESKVDWDYYKFTHGSDLVTSHSPDEIVVSDLIKIYQLRNIKEYHHFHPNLSGYTYWSPSIEDQKYVKELNVPSYLHFKGQSYRFDDIVKKYGVMPYSDFQRHIPLTIFK